MAKMRFREENRALKVGVRPLHRGEQVLANGRATDTTTVLYTVPASSMLFICSVWVTTKGHTTATDLYMAIRDALDVEVYKLTEAWFPVATLLSVSYGLYFPIEVPAGYDVYLYSGGPSGIIDGGFSGFVEAV